MKLGFFSFFFFFTFKGKNNGFWTLYKLSSSRDFCRSRITYGSYRSGRTINLLARGHSIWTQEYCIFFSFFNIVQKLVIGVNADNRCIKICIHNISGKRFEKVYLYNEDIWIKDFNHYWSRGKVKSTFY